MRIQTRGNSFVGISTVIIKLVDWPVVLSIPALTEVL